MHRRNQRNNWNSFCITGQTRNALQQRADNGKAMGDSFDVKERKQLIE